jgi:hypothetical protein
MPGYYWDFRVCRWVRCAVAAQIDGLLPGQRSDEPAEPVDPSPDQVPISPVPLSPTP